MLLPRWVNARLIPLTVGFLVATIGVEYVCRTVAPEWSDPWKVWQPNRDYVLELRPGINSELIHGTSREYEFRFSSNSQGFRSNREINRAKPEGTRRTLYLGDSFTFGYGVEQGQAFPDLITGADSVNMGLAGGMTTDTEFLFMKLRGVQWSPDTVVLGVSLRNDLEDLEKTKWHIENDQLVRITEPLHFVPVWVKSSGLFNLWIRGVWPRLQIALNKGPAPTQIATRPGKRSPASSDFTPAEKLAWILNTWAQHASDNHYRLLLVLYPEKTEVEHPRNDDPETPWARARVIYREAAASAGVESLDPLRAMRLYAMQARRQMYYSIDGHWTKEAHVFMANWLAPHLAPRDGAPLAVSPN
jgi:hypothetical protein